MVRRTIGTRVTLAHARTLTRYYPLAPVVLVTTSRSHALRRHSLSPSHTYVMGWYELVLTHSSHLFTYIHLLLTRYSTPQDSTPQTVQTLSSKLRSQANSPASETLRQPIKGEVQRRSKVRIGAKKG